MTRQSRTIFPAAVLAALMLAGCGSSAPPAPPVPPDKSVFISAKDCAESGKLKLERCGELIDAAIEDHIRSAATYTSQKACEAVEGPERCERTDKKAFRPRLLAFVVVIAGEQSISAPLYATIGGEPGFRTRDKQMFLTTDENLTFSPKAVAMYETNKFDGVPSGGYQF